MEEIPLNKNRYYILDAIRGFALLNMILYHASWDLVYMFDVNWSWYRSNGAYIWQDGTEVSRLIHADGADIIHIYAVWSPIYTVTIRANMKDASDHHQGGTTCQSGTTCQCGIYVNGNKSVGYNGSYKIIQYESGQEIASKNYYTEYKICDFTLDHVFNTPSGFGLHWYGHEITGWAVLVDGSTQYTLSSGDDAWKDPNNWEEGAGFLPDLTNLQYLQGNIVLKPQWEIVEFKVDFTVAGEAYKPTNNDVITSTVQFGSPYMILQNNSNSSNRDTVHGRIVPGYTLIYAEADNPTQSGKVIITTDGTWDYMLNYQQRTIGGKDEFFVEIEGYYAPNLYKVKLDLQLPYESDDGVVVKINGFGLEENPTEFNNRYEMSPLDREGKHTSTNYDNYQHNLFYVGGEYYIYLLQDQIIEYNDTDGAYIKDKYVDGKESEGNKVKLPTFEINYYTMQYYYTIDTSKNANQYQTAKLDNYHIALAQQKIEATSYTQVEDWKYGYNNPENVDTNIEAGTPGEHSIIYVYWYRNILNLDIQNVLNQNDSEDYQTQTKVGYVLVSEEEKVTGQALEHYKYHLVIYSQNGATLEYVVYGFDDLSVLGNPHNYGAMTGANKIVDTTIRMQDGTEVTIPYQYIPIYFGNTVTIEAVDQGNDSSMGEFVGYRFRNFGYSLNDKAGGTLTSRNEIGELKDHNKVDSWYSDGLSGYTTNVEIDLKKYEEGVGGNYFLDQDVLTIQTHFEPIKYKINYQTVKDEGGYTYFPAAGEIRVDYDGPKIKGTTGIAMIKVVTGYRFSYYVNINSLYELKHKMNIELGYEHDYWKVVKPDRTSNDLRYNFRIDEEFLRGYYATYTTELVQELTIYSVCKLMDFEVKVHVVDISQGNSSIPIRTYVLGSGVNNPLFTTSYTMNLAGDYTLTMLKKGANDSFVIYYQTGKGSYVLRKMYIENLTNSASPMFSHEFDYPSSNLGDYELTLSSSILSTAVRHRQYEEVVDTNRYINFYIQVAPVVIMDFEVETHKGDKLIGERVVTLNGVTIAEASEGSELSIKTQSTVTGTVEYQYVGYWGQEVVFGFNADQAKYLRLELEIEGVKTNVLVGNENKYVLQGNSIAVMEIIPAAYRQSSKIVYKGTFYEVPSYAEVKAGDIEIFDEAKVEANNVAKEGYYYHGDTLTVSYKLNEVILNDFEVKVYRNGYEVPVTFTGVGEANCIVTFNGTDLVIEIRVQPIPETLNITTNMPSKYTADIETKVNDGEWTPIQGEVKSIDLTNGDMLRVRVKEQVGFKFDETYAYKDKYTNPVSVSIVDGWKEFELLANGFSAAVKGTYTLNFTQIPFEVEFKYYLIDPIQEEVESSAYPTGYMASQDTEIMQSGSEVTLTKGEDKVGYRFNGYTYVSYQGNADAKELESTFTVNEEMLQHLATAGVNAKGNIPLVVYVNYVRQYTFDISVNEDTVVKVLDESNEEIDPSKYYDYGTPFKVSVRAMDKEHYQIVATISMNGVEEVVRQESQTEVEESGNTNLGHLSSFRTGVKPLTDTCKIETSVIAEKYAIKLNEQLNIGTETTGKQEELIEEESWFSLSDNIYYKTIGDFSYNTEVEIKIFVASPRVDLTQYYVLDKILINGGDVTLDRGTSEEVEGRQGLTYSIKYTMQGGLLMGETLAMVKVDILFNALYYVDLGGA